MAAGVQKVKINLAYVSLTPPLYVSVLKSHHFLHDVCWVMNW